MSDYARRLAADHRHHAAEADHEQSAHNHGLGAQGHAAVQNIINDGERPDITVPKSLSTVQGLHGPIELETSAAGAYHRIVDAARAAGFHEPLFLLTSGYRSKAKQEGLWNEALRKYGSTAAARRWVAPPGNSRHQSGKAMDFYLGVQNDSAHVGALHATRAWKWLAANAGHFGFIPYAVEPWHWEYTGG